MVRPELIRAAHWRAARYGTDDDLIDVEAQQAVPATALMEMMLSSLRPALEAEGVWEEIDSLVHETLQRGNGAKRQRAAYQRSERMEDVVALIVAETRKESG